MKRKYDFQTLEEIESFEFWNPGIFETNLEAKTAAFTCAERLLIHWRKTLERTLRAKEGSIVFNQSNNVQKRIQEVEHWLSTHVR